MLHTRNSVLLRMCRI